MAQHQRKHKRFMRSDRYENKGSYYNAGKDLWKSKFSTDIDNKLKASKIEFNNYEDNGRAIHLQQAGEKLFSVIENYLMLKYNKRVSSYKQLSDIAYKNNNDFDLLTQAKHLHLFFYDADVYADRNEMELVYKSVLRKVESILG
jgi:hypothetical protein